MLTLTSPHSQVTSDIWHAIELGFRTGLVLPTPTMLANSKNQALIGRLIFHSRFRFTTLIMPISACHCSDVRSAITSYSKTQYFVNEGSMSCLDLIERK